MLRFYCNCLFSEKVDLWSAGIVLIMMLTGEHPFHTDNMEQLFTEILMGEILVESFMDEYYGQISDEAIDLVKALIKKDPRERLSAKQALDSDWMKMKLKTKEALEATKKSLRKLMESKRRGYRPEAYEKQSLADL